MLLDVVRCIWTSLNLFRMSLIDFGRRRTSLGHLWTSSDLIWTPMDYFELRWMIPEVVWCLLRTSLRVFGSSLDIVFWWLWASPNWFRTSRRWYISDVFGASLHKFGGLWASLNWFRASLINFERRWTSLDVFGALLEVFGSIFGRHWGIYGRLWVTGRRWT